MFFSIDTVCTKFIILCWIFIFNCEPSPGIVQQAKKFLVFGTGMMAARFLSVAAQVIMGRKFGPEIYGQITMILLVASYFAMPIVNGWGLVFTKIAAKETDNSRRNQALKSLIAIVSACCILTMFVLFILQRPIANLLDIDQRMMHLSLVMTVCYAWWILSKQIAQGFQDWHTYILIENIWAVIILAGLLILAFWGKFNLITVSWIFFAGYIVAGLVLVKGIWQSLFVRIDKNYLKDILSHGWFLLLSGLVGVATFSIDRVLINKSLGAEDVGIYQAHFLSTYGIISAFMTILLTYIFPFFCREKNNDIHAVIGKLNKVQYPITIAVSGIVGGTVLWMYSFPVSFALFGSLCLFNAVQFHVQIKTWYLASKGASESRTTLQSQLIFLIINVAALLLLVGHIGIVAGGVSLLIAACSSLAYLIKSEQIAFHERIV
uniref:lipopolysaccharide biosynthesis protein n=1 Tax=Candidatus Electronema sp. TaxID=2698783 RepID=UPI0040574A03